MWLLQTKQKFRICEFYVSGEGFPRFDIKNPQIYNQSLVDFGAHDDTGNVIYHGNSFESWKKNYGIARQCLFIACILLKY